MKATESKFLAFLKNSPQFSVPIYQRTYRWDIEDCERLFSDVLHAGESERVTAHFVGSIVYIQDDIYQVTNNAPLLVIDGQQRLTTMTLLLEALARCVGESEPVPGFSAIKIRNYYLINDLEAGEKRFKLLLTQTDKTTLLDIVSNRSSGHERSIRIEENFAYFEDAIRELNGNLESLCRGLEKVMIVDIALSRGQDDPQLIFESMNSTGKELSQADLIRNFILMGLEPAKQTRLYEEHWRPMEISFGQEGYSTYFDSFMRHFLTLKNGEVPKLREVYEEFKRFARNPGFATSVTENGIEALVSEIHQHADYYCAMVLGKEVDPELARAFVDLRDVEADVSYPLLLDVYGDYKKGLLEKNQLLQIIRFIESYIFRRSVCEIPSNSMQKTFATFGRNFKKEKYFEGFCAQFLTLSSKTRFPTDLEFQQRLRTRDLYNFRRKNYYLRRFENFNRKELVLVNEYSIEHIMPQNDNLSHEWQVELGDDWKNVHETMLHTLGNLTLTGYNSEYSDSSFSNKRDMENGFAQSPLKLNDGLGQVARWDRQSIEARSMVLAQKALEIWSIPKVDEAVMLTYRRAAETRTNYTIENHPHLSVAGNTLDLFSRLRTEILAIDPIVTEEFLKYYVAYKAETNFVDIVPQARQLRLSLNMDFQDLIDPRGIVKDITDIGRWGNGNAEVRLSNIEDLPYVIDLIRQSFNAQMEIN